MLSVVRNVHSLFFDLHNPPARLTITQQLLHMCVPGIAQHFPNTDLTSGKLKKTTILFETLATAIFPGYPNIPNYINDIREHPSVWMNHSCEMHVFLLSRKQKVDQFSSNQMPTWNPRFVNTSFAWCWCRPWIARLKRPHWAWRNTFQSLLTVRVIA